MGYFFIPVPLGGSKSIPGDILGQHESIGTFYRKYFYFTWKPCELESIHSRGLHYEHVLGSRVIPFLRRFPSRKFALSAIRVFLFITVFAVYVLMLYICLHRVTMHKVFPVCMLARILISFKSVTGHSVDLPGLLGLPWLTNPGCLDRATTLSKITRINQACCTLLGLKPGSSVVQEPGYTGFLTSLKPHSHQKICLIKPVLTKRKLVTES